MRPPAFKNKHLDKVKTALILHSGPVADERDIHRKLAYYDALLERGPLDRVLPKDTFAAFDAFWIAGEFDKAYDFVTYYPMGDVDAEQRVFANELWNLLDASRWEAIEKMEANSDRIKRFFGSGVQPLPSTWHQGMDFGTDIFLSYRFSENCDSLITTARAAIYPIARDEFRRLMMHARVRVANDGDMRIVTEGPLLDFIDHPRALWCELLGPQSQISIQVTGLPSGNVAPDMQALLASRLVVFLDGWRGNGPRQQRR